MKWTHLGVALSLSLLGSMAVAADLKLSGDTVPPGAKLTDEQMKSFKAGDLYVNVHSEANKGGEIRAQLKP